jgi:ATP-binding cassette, subfamily B (MDR/TAP), member 1
MMASTEPEAVMAADPPIDSDVPSVNGAGGDKADNVANVAPESKPKIRPEREATFKDYLRIFSYAKKWDYALLLGAGFASIGAGTVGYPVPQTRLELGTSDPL